jgi:hypothetical protein
VVVFSEVLAQVASSLVEYVKSLKPTYKNTLKLAYKNKDPIRDAITHRPSGTAK